MTGTGAASSPFRFFGVSVSGIEDVTPHLRRFTFEGPDLDDFANPGLDQRIKLVLPAPSSGYRSLPNGDNWYPQWRRLGDEERPPIRTYTTRAVRRGTAGTRVDVDMVVHAPLGPASQWISTARAGDAVVLLGPSRSWSAARPDEPPAGVDFVPPAITERFLLGGDETAAPAIARILQDLDAGARGIAVVELPSSADAGYLPAHPGIEVRALGRDGRAHGELLVEGVREAAARLCPEGAPGRIEETDMDHDLLWDVPRTARGGAALRRTSLYAWLAGEAAAVRAMRRHLVGERGIDRRAVAFMGYWRLGRAEN